MRRQNMSEATVRALEGVKRALEGNEARQERAREPKKPRASNFSTDYAIKWGRARGWKLLDRENYDFRMKRHHDLPLGADAMFETPDGICYVQGAGCSERKRHWTRFVRSGGADRCVRLRCKFIYVEFVRGDHEPLLVEDWA